ncbi:MAG TPA: hypothetical protein VH439_03960 [Gemmatimonadales bacterium]|jgi:hypothetical protein
MNDIEVSELTTAGVCPRCGANYGAERAPRIKPRDVIAKQYRDSDGYWIELRPGWQNGADRGTHAIVENTKRAALRGLAYVKPCACEECRRLLAKEVPTH